MIELAYPWLLVLLFVPPLLRRWTPPHRDARGPSVPRMAGPKTAFGDAIGLGITLFERSEQPSWVMSESYRPRLDLFHWPLATFLLLTATTTWASIVPRICWRPR
jgi:hypothetical protein